ncbi:MAG: helix-turn-helix transcriptional regulator [Methylococcales bacterium]|jgi:transcriptional regulator with XRE-family HTH domain|nr:helix-turn-helix transcriptional regulator [Methylococcales bacterium]MBT7445056.1 helix-turn-helix transcriptional regulator [Methylococcales bacterium]
MSVRMTPIRKFRLDCGWTQEEFAKQLDIKQPAVSNYEKGTRFPKRQVAKKIIHMAETYGYKLTMDDLYDA